MASLHEADAATEALIAQLLAEDFGEAYADHMRPIGSHAGDYEDPLTSYERQCLDNPDMEDGEGGWNPPTPKIEPVAASTLPEGESWDSSINNDPRIESTPFTPGEHSKSNEGFSEGSVKVEESLHHVQDAVDNRSVPDEPLHHIQDPIEYHTDNPTKSLTRHVSVPVHELVYPPEDGRRVVSDPSRLEKTTDSPRQDSPIPILSEPTQSQSLESNPLLPNHSAPKEPTASHPPLPMRFSAPTIATNERLLNLINDTSKSNLDRSSFLNAANDFNLNLEDFGNFDSTIDTSSAKNKGKDPATDTSINPDDRLQSYLDRYKALCANRNDDEVDYSSDKNKGKAAEGPDIRGNQLAKYIGRKTKIPLESIDKLGDDLYGDESIDKESGLLLLHVPWPDSIRRDRELREAMDAQVHEVWVGEEETVESILLDIRESEELRERPWGSWGVGADGGGGGGSLRKGKGKAVEC